MHSLLLHHHRRNLSNQRITSISPNAFSSMAAVSTMYVKSSQKNSSTFVEKMCESVLYFPVSCCIVRVLVGEWFVELCAYYCFPYFTSEYLIA